MNPYQIYIFLTTYYFVTKLKRIIIINKIIMINTSIFTFAITDWFINLKVTCKAKQYPFNISLWYKTKPRWLTFIKLSRELKYFWKTFILLLFQKIKFVYFHFQIKTAGVWTYNYDKPTQPNYPSCLDISFVHVLDKGNLYILAAFRGATHRRGFGCI